MSVRFLALELYRCLKRLEDLEKAKAERGPETDWAELRRLETEILLARKEVEHYRKLLEAQKEPPKI
jgi:hypothetical protein